MFDENLYQETISALHASEDTLSEVMNMTHKTKRRGLSLIHISEPTRPY